MSSFYVYGILWRPRGSSLYEKQEDLVLLNLTTNQQLFRKCSTKASQKNRRASSSGVLPRKDSWECATEWGRYDTTGLTLMPVVFWVEIQELPRNFFWDLEGKKILVRKDLKMGRFAVKNSCIGQKLSKMGSIIGHKIDFNVVGVLRGQRHTPRKNWPNYPPPQKKKKKQKTNKQTKTYLTKGLCLCGSYWEGSISAQASALREECEALGILRSKKWEEFLIF